MDKQSVVYPTQTNGHHRVGIREVFPIKNNLGYLAKNAANRMPKSYASWFPHPRSGAVYSKR
ncbi:hypothetical protein EMIT0P43_10113 [Pseudomonas jessenii]